MVFERISLYLKQFRPVNVCRLFLVDLIRKILDPYCIFSYSQTGEDRILCAILAEKIDGYYVDVGCNHPQRLSNTFMLYKRGWKGITIDANEKLIAQHSNLRPKDISVCAVISNKEQEMVFTDFDDSLVSSVCSEHVDDWSQHRKINSQRLVKAVSLNRILSDHQAPCKFDLLAIDVEGHDFEVLSSLDLTLYRPQFIVIEMHNFDILNPTSNQIYNFLISNRYKMLGYMIMNGYFMDDEPQH
jgi:FkbM family methyltransferase